MAADTPTRNLSRKRRIRRRFVLFLVAGLFLVGIWKAVETYVDIERYRPLIQEELESLTELPLDFGAMDLRLLPTPRLVVRDVTLGEEHFHAYSPKVTVTADVGQLIKKRLDLRVVTIHDARVRLPAETPALRKRWGDYLHALATREQGDGNPLLQVTLARIVSNETRVFRGDVHYATGDLQVDEVTGGAPRFTFSAHGDAIAGNPAAQGTFVLDVNSDPPIAGQATVTHMPLAILTGDEKLPPFMLDADTDFALAQDNSVRVDAEGTIALDGAADRLGSFSLLAGYASGNLGLNRLHIDSEPLDFQGDLELLQDSRWMLAIEEATLRERGITWLVDRLPGLPLAATPGVASRGVITDMRMGDEDGNGFSIAEGAIDVKDVGLILPGGLLLPAISGDLIVEHDTLHLKNLASRHAEARGDVALEYTSDTVSLDLAGKLLLGPGFPLPDGVAQSFRTDAGQIDIAALQATFVAGRLQADALQLRAGLDHVAIAARDDASGEFVPVPEVTGAIAMSGGVLEITELTGAGSQLSGTATPDAHWERWTFSGEFTSDLANPLWKPLIPAGALTLTQGTLVCTKLAGVFTAPDLPEALELEATINNLAADVHATSYNDQIAAENIKLTASDTGIHAELTGRSSVFGPVSATGRMALATRDIEGEITLHPARAGILPPTYREGTTGAMLADLGALPLQVDYSHGGGLLRFTAEDPYPLSGTLRVTPPQTGGAPFSLTATAAVPMARLEPYLPGLDASGTMQVHFSVSPEDGSVLARADATATDIQWSILRKRPGFDAVVALDGRWEAKGPAFTRGHLRAGNESIDFDVAAAAIDTGDFSLDLASFGPLLPPGMSLAGGLRGRYGREPGELALLFEDATLALESAAPPLTANGPARWDAGDWTLDGLELALEKSRGALNAGRRDGTWSGELHAERFTIDELIQLYQSYDSLDIPDGGATAPSRPTGVLRVTADRLDWVEASVEDARWTVESTPRRITLGGASFVYGEGTGAGQVVYTPARAERPAAVEAELRLNKMDAGLLEGILLDEARGLKGLIDGAAALSFPLRPESPSVLHDMNGTIRFEAFDGTLGKAGLATKLLTALRTTDILRLKLPQLRDRGLTFEELAGHIEIESGVLRLERFAMADTTYILEANATFDFPEDTAEGEVDIQILEGVTGIARRIPILGEAANLVNKVFGVPIKIVGPASDPAFRVGRPR